MNTSHIVADWANQTTLHPMGVVALIVLGVMTFFVPRRFGLLPILLLACFVASAQRIVFATLDFNLLRILVLLAWARVLVRGEVRGWQWNMLDVLVLLWVGIGTVTYMLLYGTLDAFVYRLGMMYDAIGLYFLCRVMVRDHRDIRNFAFCAALISVPVAAAFLYELSTAQNVFSVFGGVPDVTVERFGRLRCQGPFMHPILAGAFWAGLTPLLIALWFDKGWMRIASVMGVLSAIFVVIACASATPLVGMMAAVIGMLLLPMRRYMTFIRWGSLVTIILMQMVMISPFWHLIARITLVSGSTGWYRYKLIDDFLGHAHQWWLIGSTSFSGWWQEGTFAITNHYVAQGINGGAITLVLFIAMIVIGFVYAGRIIRQTERTRRIMVATRTKQPRKHVRRRHRRLRRRITPRLALTWAVGVCLFVHTIEFFGVLYFGQTIFVWYLTLAMLGSLRPEITRVTSAKSIAVSPPVDAGEQSELRFA
jgi:hypothetical protein